MSSDIIKHTAQQDCEHACSQSFNTLIADVRQIIENGRNQAYNAVEQVGITTFWNVGRRIVVELQHGEARAEYGTHLIKNLAEAIVPLYGNTYSKRNTIARYSVLHDSEQIFAAKYMPYMPTEEELRQEIEQQKQFFLEQHK